MYAPKHTGVCLPGHAIKCFIFVLFIQKNYEGAKLVSGSEDPELDSSGDGLALVSDIQFAIDVVGVLLDCARGDVQPG